VCFAKTYFLGARDEGADEESGDLAAQLEASLA
jgi:hypothetical protein